MIACWKGIVWIPGLSIILRNHGSYGSASSACITEGTISGIWFDVYVYICFLILCVCMCELSCWPVNYAVGLNVHSAIWHE
jgi:hypothetical protein